MKANRLEAFSDGVFAIIITIMVLELKVPHEPHWPALFANWPIFAGYALSFLYVAIYWNNHHHLLHTVERVSPGILWGNMHLLFWLSLIPFSTGWSAEAGLTSATAGFYGIILLMAAVAYYMLSLAIKQAHGPSSRLAQATGQDVKGKISLAACVAGIAAAFVDPRLSVTIYAIVAMMWFIPDKRIAHALGN